MPITTAQYTQQAQQVLAKLQAANAHQHVLAAVHYAARMERGSTATLADVGRAVATQLRVPGNKPQVTVGKRLRGLARDAGNGAQANGQAQYPPMTGPQLLAYFGTGSMAVAMRTQGEAGKAQQANAAQAAVLANARKAQATRAGNVAQATPQQATPQA